MTVKVAWGFVLVATVFLSPTPAVAVTDVIGGTDNSSLANPWDGKGNVFRIDSSVFLREHEFFLNFSGSQSISYYVYRSPSEFGTYDLVQSNSILHNGIGDAWYSSGPINVMLHSADHYLLAFSYDSSTTPVTTYYFNTAETLPVSFGAYVHGFATGVHPLGATVNSGSNDQAVYYHRITTTEVPEPASLLLAAGGLIAVGHRRRWRREE